MSVEGPGEESLELLSDVEPASEAENPLLSTDPAVQALLDAEPEV